MINYDERLNELQEQIASKNRLETVLKALRKQQEELEEKVAELECKKWKEQADVECMEKRSLTNFFYYVVGKMDEKLTAERQEAYQAAVSYDVACKELEAVKKDIKRYTIYLTSNSVGIKLCCNAKNSAGTIIATYLFLIVFTPHPKYKPSSANAVDIGKTTTLIIASHKGIGAIIIGAA